MKLATVWRRGLVATLETPTVEDAKGRWGRGGWAGLGVRDAVGARKQRQLTIFCDATGAGSSLYLRALSGTFGCDIAVIAPW